MSIATLYGWARRIEVDATNHLRAFEVQQTRNLNHCIPVQVTAATSCPRWLVDTAPVRVVGEVRGTAPVPGDPYPPAAEFHALEFATVDDFSMMPPERTFNIVPPPEAATDNFLPPLDQFGSDEDITASNQIVVCGILDQAKLTDGVNDYLRRDSMELLLRLAPPPAHPVQVRLYGKHAQTYSRLMRDGLPLKVSGPLRIRTKPGIGGGLRRMLYIHCAHLQVPRLDEMPYIPSWLGVVDAPA